jgi:hypothetical protein
MTAEGYVLSKVEECPSCVGESSSEAGIDTVGNNK